MWPSVDSPNQVQICSPNHVYVFYKKKTFFFLQKVNQNTNHNVIIDICNYLYVYTTIYRYIYTYYTIMYALIHWNGKCAVGDGFYSCFEGVFRKWDNLERDFTSEVFQFDFLFIFLGSAWLSAIVTMIQANGDPSSLLQGEPLDEKVPYLEFCTSANYAGRDEKNVQSSQRADQVYTVLWRFFVIVLQVTASSTGSTKCPQDGHFSRTYPTMRCLQVSQKMAPKYGKVLYETSSHYILLIFLCFINIYYQ